MPATYVHDGVADFRRQPFISKEVCSYVTHGLWVQINFCFTNDIRLESLLWLIPRERQTLLVMVIKKKGIPKLFTRLKSFFSGTDSPPPDELPTARPILFSADQLSHYGKELAESHLLGTGCIKEKLLTKLMANETSLLSTHAALILDIKAQSRITPAGEWLLDNFYVVEEQIRLTRSHLPKGYSQGLPFLSNGDSTGLPRIYDIANTIIIHSDGGLDMANLGRIIASYQSVAILNLGELWAFPIMLRLALVEELTRNATLIMYQRKGRMLADDWADKLIATTKESPKDLVLTLSDMAISNPTLSSAFVSELTRRLHGLGATLAIPLAWVEQQVVDSGMSVAQVIERENRSQAANQVSMGNCIASLRLLASMNWKEFVETMSRVEQTLRGDHDGTYAKMDFTTRDQYRHVIEEAAQFSCYSESVIAKKAIELAADAAQVKGYDDRTAHVGYYLIDKGLPLLDKSARVRRPVRQRIQNACKAHSLFVYFGCIAALTAAAVAVMANAFNGGAFIILFCVLSIMCGGHLATALVNWMVTIAVKPHPLPRMDFSGGIPHEYRTLVAIPSMLVSTSNIEALFDDLEVRFLANKDEALHFCLLTDFIDAASEELPRDKALLRQARRKTKELNDKYRSSYGDVFFLFHRPRQWNPEEKLWMGYERKRGKIADLNNVLRNGSTDNFSLIIGEISILGNVILKPL